MPPTYSRRQRHALILTGLVIGMLAVPALAAVFSNPVPQSGTVPYQTNSGATIHVAGDVNTSSGNPFLDDETVRIETTDGNATFSSTGGVNATVNASDLTGTWTNVSSLNVTQARLIIDPEDKRTVGVEGNTSRLAFRNTLKPDDGTTDIIYAGSTGTTTIEIRDLTADEWYLLRDVDTNQVLGGAQADGSGTVVITGLPNSQHTTKLQTNDPPNFDSTTASPTGSYNDFPSELSINVSDPDMPGDNVTVDFYLNGVQVGTDNRTTAGEINTSINPDRGTHTWYVVATDDSGQSAQSQTFTFSTPTNLTFRNESSPNQIIDNRKVTATFYYGDTVESRNTTTGNISLDGLPTDTRIHIQAETHQGDYHDRTVTIESLGEQTDVYLLNTSAPDVTAVDVRFKIDDQTGLFPPGDTVLEVRKPITQNNTTTYRTVAGDIVAANGLVTTLEQGVRYRLVVRNQQGDVRVLGKYTAPASETVTLTIGALEFEFTTEDGYQYDGAQNDDTDTFTFNYSDPSDETENLHVKIYKRNNESVVLHNQTYPGPLGNLSISEPIPAQYNESEFTVEWTADRDNEVIQGRANPGRRTTVLPSVDDQWKQIASILMLFMTAAVFSQANASIGSVVVALTAGWLWYVNWLGDATTGAAIVIAVGTAAWIKYGTQEPQPL